jgi:hypothetical protein
VIVAAGHVSERPFARTIYAIAARRLTGDLVLTEGGRRYVVGWDRGQVVGAESAAPTDSAGRVALTAGLVTSTAVAQSLQIMAQRPGADQIDVLAELARLSPDHVASLRRRVLAHRAARMFALADARFELDDRRVVPDEPVPPIDPRWLIYHGLRSHYDEARLDRELSTLAGKTVGLAPDAFGVIGHFGFGERERPVLEILRDRTIGLDELAASTGGLERRAVLAVVYALGACDCLAIGSAPARPTPAPMPAVPDELRATHKMAREPTMPPASAVAAGSQVRFARPAGTTVPPRPVTPSTSPPRVANPSTSPPRPAPATTTPPRPANSSTSPPPGPAAAEEARRLIREKLRELDAGSSHFALLGASPAASPGELRTAYFALAKRLHPDRLRAVGVLDMASDAQRLFAAINQAFGVLSDPARRREYEAMQAAGGTAAVARQEAEAEELAVRVFGAEEAFRKGEMALRRGQFAQARGFFEEAATLSPDDAEHQAMLAWTTWVASDDKQAVVADVQRRLRRALELSDRCVPAHYYRGMIAKQSGKDELAIDSFRKVLELKPGHADADLELRVLIGRQRKAKESLFGKRK